MARHGLLNILLAVRFSHVGITVTDLDRSPRFYESNFPFDPSLARSYPDGTLILRDADDFALALGDGFALALNPGDGARPLTSYCTSTTPAAAPEEVRALRERLLGAGEMLTEDEDSESFVSIKVTDPDGYRVEISWEDLTRDPL